MYKDDNHKPEMAIALTDFEALCGFVEHSELVHALQTVPELQSVVGQVRLSQGLDGAVNCRGCQVHAGNTLGQVVRSLCEHELQPLCLNICEAQA